MEQKGQRSKRHTERRILVPSYATGLWPRFATLVRGSSRRITTMKASASSILEYQSDQPSKSPLDRCPFCSNSETEEKRAPLTFLLRGRSISGGRCRKATVSEANHARRRAVA